ncbi:MAG TPA: type VII secretion protein EccCa [Trebonia sp.]|jgi:S-DNA-T family DNA segregation ATPase FtsK/SpoIIIE|nr:type VII secretion protein EccCa [Trebonia sp.]
MESRKLSGREPRTQAPPMPDGEIVLQSPPEVPEPASDGFAQALMYVPMGAMAIGMVAVVAGGHASSVMYVGSGAMAVGMVGMMVGQIARGKGDRKVKLNGLRRDYLRYLSQVRAKVRQAATQQRAAMERDAPAPGALTSLALAGEVWEKTPSGAGFLNARIATGTQALALRLVPPETKPAEDLDPLCSGALRSLIRTHASVPALPVSVSLGSVTRICLTGEAEARDDMVRALLAQVAVTHSPKDVSIIVCASTDRISAWEWVKWLPHNRHPTELDAAGPARLMVPGLDWLPGILGKELSDRPRFAPGAGSGSHPFYLVITDGVPAEGEIVGVDGVVILDLSPEKAAPPSNIGSPMGLGAYDPTVLRLRVTRDQVYRQSGDDEVPVGVPDALSRPEAEALARTVAPLRPPSEDQAEDALAADVSLTALLGVDDPRAVDVQSMWRRRSPRDLLRVPIGTDADGNPVELDIKESAQGGMGPHGLVVGATGSGKSELLRTLVLGLAMTHSPSELNFVLVDFKGGATFLGLDTLPHVSAVITNLADELPLVDRMRDALHGEVVRRQEVFRASGNYASLRDYSRARAEGAKLAPMPTLFVVLDEFSELLAAKPEFIDLFVMIGRVGRSLGVHLLLASQRLEEGRLRGLDTQLSYRIGLRTFSAMESRTVLGVPDAYELPSQPGNGYLKVDTTGMTRFKAGYVSGPASAKSHSPERSLPPHLRPAIAPYGPAFIPPSFVESADAGPVPMEVAPPAVEALLDVVVGQIAGHGDPAHQIWLPPLGDPPSLDALLPPLSTTGRGLSTTGGEGQATLQAVLGIVDKPFEQRRDPFSADLSGSAGHVAVVGAPRSGKSTALRTLVSSLALLHTPAEVQFYILDFGGGALAALDGLPHVGGVASRLAADRVRRTVAEVRTLLERREASFAEQNIDSIATYRRMVASGDIESDGFGDVFLVVDGWLTLRQDFEELEPVVTSLAARGLGYGVHLAAATNKWSEFRPAVRDLFGTRLELRLGDPYESEVGRAAAANVPEGAPGRGLTRDGLHFLSAVPRIDGQQTATGLPGAAHDFVTAVRDAWTGDGAPPVRMLPAVLPAAELPAAGKHRVPFGIDENALAPVSADFGADPHLLVIGDTECGKSNLLRVLCAGITSARTPEEARMIFVDYRRSLLDSAEVPHQIGYATSSASAGPLLADVREALVKRLPPPDLTPEQLRARSWWSGAELYLIVDDYDLVASTSGSPLSVLSDLLPQARDIGLHVLLARAAGGAGRGMFEPVVQRLREMGTPGLIMSGSRDEGQLLGGIRPTAQPAGRGFFVERRAGSRLVQTALLE